MKCFVLCGNRNLADVFSQSSTYGSSGSFGKNASCAYATLVFGVAELIIRLKLFSYSQDPFFSGFTNTKFFPVAFIKDTNFAPSARKFSANFGDSCLSPILAMINSTLLGVTSASSFCSVIALSTFIRSSTAFKFPYGSALLISKQTLSRTYFSLIKLLSVLETQGYDRCQDPR